MLKILKMKAGIAAVVCLTVEAVHGEFEGEMHADAVYRDGEMPVVDYYTGYVLTGKTQQEIPIDKVFGPDDVAKIVKHFEAVFALPIGQRQAYLELVRGDWK